MGKSSGEGVFCLDLTQKSWSEKLVGIEARNPSALAQPCFSHRAHQGQLQGRSKEPGSFLGDSLLGRGSSLHLCFWSFLWIPFAHSGGRDKLGWIGEIWSPVSTGMADSTIYQ